MAFLDDGRLLLSTFTPNNNGVLRSDNGTLWVWMMSWEVLV